MQKERANTRSFFISDNISVKYKFTFLINSKKNRSKNLERLFQKNYF